MNFYSENGEDRWIVENLPLPEVGTFVDVGANCAQLGSNTLHFVERGWRGLAIDLDQQYALQWMGKCEFMLAAIGPQGFSRVHFEGGLTRLTGTAGQGVIVPRIPLYAALDMIPFGIDLLSLDIEGGEYDALTTLGSHRPRIIVSEFLTARLEDGKYVENCDRRADGLLASLGYRKVYETKNNAVFLES